MTDWRVKAFIISCSEGDLLTYNLLIPQIRNTFGINIQDSNGTTPIAAAIKSNQITIIRKLLKEDNLFLHHPDLNGKTALDYFLTGNCWEITRSLMEITEIDESCNLKLNNAILNYAYSRERYKFKLILQFTRKNCFSNHNLINKILYTGRRFYINELFKHFQENMTNNIITQEFNTQAITVALSNGIISIAKPLFRIFEDKFIDSLETAKELGLHPKNLSGRKIMKYIQDDLSSGGIREQTFDRTLPHVDINFQDQNGNTLLMKLIKNDKLGEPSSRPDQLSRKLTRIKSLTNIDQLKINLLNKEGESIIDFINLRDASELNEKEKIASELILIPFDTNIRGILDKNDEDWQALASPDLNLLRHFNRVKTMPIVDFNCSRSNLIIKAVDKARVDIIMFLLYNTNFRVSGTDILTIKSMLENREIMSNIEENWSKRLINSLQCKVNLFSL